MYLPARVFFEADCCRVLKGFDGPTCTLKADALLTIICAL